jgi:hypothetical protein
MNYSWTIELTARVFHDEDAYVVSLSESGPSGMRTWRYAVPAVDTEFHPLIREVGRRHPAFAKVLGDALIEYLSHPDLRRTSGDFYVADP